MNTQKKYDLLESGTQQYYDNIENSVKHKISLASRALGIEPNKLTTEVDINGSLGCTSVDVTINSTVNNIESTVCLLGTTTTDFIVNETAESFFAGDKIDLEEEINNNYRIFEDHAAAFTLATLIEQDEGEIDEAIKRALSALKQSGAFTTDDERFKEYISEVDEVLQARVGLSSSDFPDTTIIRSCFDYEVSAENCAEEILEDIQ